MAAAGFKGTVSLTVDGSGARLTDAVTGHVVELTELEGRVLELFRGQTAETLAGEAQAAGVGLWPDQVRVVLERIEAHGFLARPLNPETAVTQQLGANDVVPRFRPDLSLSKAPGSRSAIHVVDPVTQQAFSLFDFEASIARMLNGARTVAEVITLASKIGIPVTIESLERFIRQLRSFGFLDANVSSAAPSSWDPRDAWSPDVRELYQAALRLMRGGNPQQAISYIDAILQTNPDLPEALDLRARAEAAAAGTIDLTLPFNELHAGAPPGGTLSAPPPPPDETTAEHVVVAPPPTVPKVEGLGLLPTPNASPLRAAGTRSTMIFGARPPPPVAPISPPAPVAAAQVPVSIPSDSVPPPPRERSTLVFGANPLETKSSPGFGSDPAALGIRPRESSSGPRQFNSVLFGASSGAHNIAEAPPPTEPLQSVFVAGPSASPERAPGRQLQPPSASPPPHGAQALAGPLGGSDPYVPTVDAEVAPMPQEPLGSNVEVDSIALVPQGSSIEIDPSLSAESATDQSPPAPHGFLATDLDGPPSPEQAPTPEELLAGVPDAVAQTPLDAAFAAPAAGERVSQEMMVLAGTPPEPKKKRRGMVIAAVLVTLFAMVMAVPVPREVDAAAVVGPVVLAEPMAQAEGKVAELVVKSGDVVAAGTVLVKLTVPEPPEARALAQKEAELKAKADKIRAAARTSPRAKKANAALAKADKELTRAKAAWARQEPKKPSADRNKAKKALDAKQKARDKAQALADVENGAKRIATFEAEMAGLAEQRAKLTREAEGTTIVAPAAGRFEAPAKHALGMGLEKGERYGRIVDPGLWKVTAKELPVSTEPATARLYLENGRIVDLTGSSISGEGATRVLEGNALLTDDATSAGKTVLRVRAGKRPLAVMVLQKLRGL